MEEKKRTGSGLKWGQDTYCIAHIIIRNQWAKVTFFNATKRVPQCGSSVEEYRLVFIHRHKHSPLNIKLLSQWLCQVTMRCFGWRRCVVTQSYTSSWSQATQVWSKVNTQKAAVIQVSDTSEYFNDSHTLRENKGLHNLRASLEYISSNYESPKKFLKECYRLSELIEYLSVYRWQPITTQEGQNKERVRHRIWLFTTVPTNNRTSSVPSANTIAQVPHLQLW